MNSLSPTFCSFENLVDWIHAESPRSRCAYLGNVGSPCRTRIGQSMVNQARSLVAEHLDILTGLSGALTVTSTRSQVFQELATRVLCRHHNKHNSRAIAQWRQEFSTRRISVITKLGLYYNYGTEGSSDEGSGEDADEIDESVCYSDSEAREWEQEQFPSEGDEAYDEDYAYEEEEATEEDHISEEEDESEENAPEEDDRAEERFSPEKQEGVSNTSCPPSSPTVRRHRPTIPKEDVAREVTLLLKQPAKRNSEKPGWLYVIRPPQLPGMFKVGFTGKPPEHRFTKHMKCHPEFEVITTRLIPYAYRVEQLILKEFSNNHWELENGCQKCDGTFHRELLDVDKETLLKSVEKWINFVESNPYSMSGNLTKEAKEDLPRPASQSYLKCKPSCLWTPPRSSAKEKPASQDFQVTPVPGPNFKPPAPTAKSPSVEEVKIDSDIDSDGSCSGIGGLQATPSKPKRKGK